MVLYIIIKNNQMKKNNRQLYGYISTNRSKHNLKIHLIFIYKYRKKLLTNKINDDIKDIIRSIENKSEIIEMETDKDHIHLMIQFIPRISVSAIVNRIKSITTYHIWRKNNYFLSKHFWKEKIFWSDGYFVCSVGEASPETIQKYIQNQG